MIARIGRKGPSSYDLTTMSTELMAMPYELLRAIFAAIGHPQAQVSFLLTCRIIYHVCVEDLYKLVAQDDAVMCSAIPAICRADNSMALRRLIDAGFEFKQFWFGSMSLAYAATRYTAASACVRLLISRGADTSERTRSGETLVHGVLRSPQLQYRGMDSDDRHRALELLEHLLQMGVSTNLPSGEGTWALCLAVSAGHHAVRLLLRSGADPNERTESGDPLLQHSVIFGSQATMIELLKAGADVHAVNYTGGTVLRRCINTKPWRIPPLLQYGATKLSGYRGKHLWHTISQTLPLQFLEHARLAFTDDCFEED